MERAGYERAANADQACKKDVTSSTIAALEEASGEYRL
jgi:hypothetical protein